MSASPSRTSSRIGSRSPNYLPFTPDFATVILASAAGSSSGVGSLNPVQEVTRRTVVTNIGVVLLPVRVLGSNTFSKATTNFVTGAPDHLRVVTNLNRYLL